MGGIAEQTRRDRRQVSFAATAASNQRDQLAILVRAIGGAGLTDVLARGHADLRPQVQSLQRLVGNRNTAALLTRRWTSLAGNRTPTRAPTRVQRQATVSARVPRAADYREHVNDSIRLLTASAGFYRHGQLNTAHFERVINAWYAIVIDREQTIRDRLDGDLALQQRLRAAYVAALRVIMSRAAALFGRPEAELYRENDGRIPSWAWQIPHHTEPGISTPISEGQQLTSLAR